MANPSQTANGILQRLRARAFTFREAEVDARPIAFVSLDAGMSGYVLKKRVMSALNRSLPGVYDDASVCVSGTHRPTQERLVDCSGDCSGRLTAPESEMFATDDRVSLLQQTVRLRNGVEMPVLGLGTHMMRGSQCEDAVRLAID